MKQIIFQVIYCMLLTKYSALTFSHSVIANLIEQLNIYGTSVDKFRRILKVLIMDKVYKTKHLKVLSHFDWKKMLDSKYDR